jgi:Fe-S-cluster containining protein
LNFLCVILAFAEIEPMTEQADPSGIPVKTFTIIVETPDGAMPPARVQVPDIPMGLADLVPPMYELCNGAIALAIRRSESMGKKVTCGPGCGVCCRQLVPLSIPEAIFLAEHARGLAPDRSAALQERFEDARSILHHSGLLEKIRAFNGHEDDLGTAAAYFRLGIACPFLSAESCGIHQVRPCACREFNVTSPPKFCADPLRKKTDRVAVHRKMTTALARAAARLTGAQQALVPLPLLFDWYESHSEYAALRWKGIGLFDVMLEFALGRKVG